MKRAALFIGLPVLAGGLFWQFPLFHVVPFADQRASQYEAAFDAAQFAETFWSERLVPSLCDAPDARAVLAAFDKDPQVARNTLGRKFGIGRARLFLLRGSGTVVDIDRNRIGVALQAGTAEPDVMLHTGLLFGNAVRDASGLLDPSDFSNSQYFNDISTELNRLVEARVIPKAKEICLPGRTIHFAGCAEISDDEHHFRPLKLIILDVGLE